ncbi:hypothetical protein Dsin_000289 [Dipteronia sinensis]|uniref:Uncharacterized protein n=1 Tax=Dipteronia sinensis TaxID=43782 RepID=A0AAE0B2K1_9ROSI|nr:hypothetical protein Dsin_000289 [Dipteronia sinensis]
MASRVRLDRFLISPWILSWFPKLAQNGLPRIVSDHNAITLGEPRDDRAPSPFHFYNNWLEDDELMKLASEGWKNCKVSGLQGFVLSSKLKCSKNVIKNCILSRAKVSSSLKANEESLTELDRRTICYGLYESVRKDLVSTLEDLWKDIRREEQNWHQK